MKAGALLDTGPLVALLNVRDRRHAWATEVFRGLRAPLLTCDAVLSEACFLLRAFPAGVDAVMSLVEQGLVDASFRLSPEVPVVRRLLARYADVPMSFADACLVRMSELHPDLPVVTCDRDFTIYRRNGRRVIPTLMPGEP